MPDPTASFEAQIAPADAIAALQSEVDQLRRELEHSHRLATLGVLAAGVAHEINNVLTPVLAYAQLAAGNPGDSQFQSKALKKAVSGVEMATQIAQAILGFSGQPNEPRSAKILATLNDAIDCLGRHPQKDKIKLTIDVPPDACVQIRPLALQQILMNLILNACAAMRPRGGSLTISAESVRPGTTEIKCTDTGPGIPKEVGERLFQPFVTSAFNRNLERVFSHAHTKATAAGGTGLGLAICKRLIDEAGGTISASSRPGIGTTFSIILSAIEAKKAA